MDDENIEDDKEKSFPPSTVSTNQDEEDKEYAESMKSQDSKIQALAANGDSAQQIALKLNIPIKEVNDALETNKTYTPPTKEENDKINEAFPKCPYCDARPTRMDYHMQANHPEKKKAMLNGEDESILSEATNSPAQSDVDIYSPEWNACVIDCQEKNSKTNAYAICTAQLSEKSFKKEYQHLSYTKSILKKAQREVEKMGTEAAGPIPNSLLARQDLEGEAEESEVEVPLGQQKGVK